MKQATFVIIGGGIAGVSCAEGLSFLSPDKTIILISASPTVKMVSNVKHLTKMLTEFDVTEREIEALNETCPNVNVIQGFVKSVDPNRKYVYLENEEIVEYEKLCICSGAKPKLIYTNDEHIVGIRDTDSVKELQRRIAASKKVVIIGNGGIATELVYKIRDTEVVWVIKDSHISAAFIDPGAAQFFEERVYGQIEGESAEGPVKRLKYVISNEVNASGEDKTGAALGPDWHTNVDLKGVLQHNKKVTIEYCCELKQLFPGNEIKDKEWPVYVELTNGKIIGCDFIVSATGVVPSIDFIKDTGVELASDGGIKVDWKLESSLKDVYAAGDACTCSWDLADHWLQIRLWTQARQMGTYAAKAMHCSVKNEEFWQDFCFELFTHVTSFFGMKVVLLGLFNGQRLDNTYEILLRVTKGQEYVKLILKNGRMQGAVLVGDTDLEEMCENLILNHLDLTDVADDLLDPNLDIDDYFD
ncbi:pyridine nucleotide-disulfide oxidoreductase domain 1 isoform X2 [Rhodnius prolixus]|uniref:Pyridine nucleotide-disulfide oxidoreductase domain-containing protein 1 n=2 Tax=Rhodnius TaxID=13248 RepID=R4FNT7_RHOPR